MRHSVFALFIVSLTACAVFGGGSSDDDEQPGGGSSSSGAPGTPPPPLDGTPSEDKITEQYGVFVSPGGAADADGTRDKPFGTIAAGLERAIASNKYVYVCAGTFKESIKVGNGVSMIGGFDCEQATWKLNGLRTRVESPTSPAMTASGINAPTRIEGFEIIAPDGTDQSPTSIGLHAKSSPAITFAKSRIVAGKGKDGLAGEERAQLTLAASANGSPSSAQLSGPTSAFIGFPLHRSGEAGGVGGCDGLAGITKPEDGKQGGKGGSYTSKQTCPPASVCGWYWEIAMCGAVQCSPTTPTKVVAATGAAGNDGASATEQGTLTGEGFTPRDGTEGTNGEPGTGGSGGAGGTMDSAFAGVTAGGQQYGYGATGPGGGAGGCPGLAGSRGKGGGASIGALLVSSKGLVFDATEVVAGNGGAGGKGAFGTNPTNGGAAGTALGVAGAAEPGGAGGRSGVSGSGAGGPSFGIASTLGDASLVNGASAKSGQGGAGVPEEKKTDALGNAKTQPASIAGDAKDQISF